MIEEIIRIIKNQVEACKTKREMFHLPIIEGVCIHEMQLPVHGSILLHTQYILELSTDEMIKIDYMSKDKCRAFQVNPDESIISVETPYPYLDFNDYWDEKY